MPSKYCPDCDKITCSASMPTFCAWCGRSLVERDVLPKYDTYEEREQVLKQAREDIKIKRDAGGQIKLF